MNSNDNDDENVGTPIPSFNASSIQLRTIAPALGIHSGTPDYLDYDPHGRGIVVTMFANAGMSYMVGTFGGGAYGVWRGRQATPSQRWRVQLNSILNHSGRYGSRTGNAVGVIAVLYSLYEGLADNVSTTFIIYIKCVCECVRPCFHQLTLKLINCTRNISSNWKNDSVFEAFRPLQLLFSRQHLQPRRLA
jgi:hypothetical protein